MIAFIRLLAATAIMLMLALLAVPAWIAVRVFKTGDGRRKTGDVSKATTQLALFVRIGCRMLLAALGVRRSRRGPAPGEGTLIVANHLSWTDILVLLANWKCAFVAKGEVRRWPVVGVLAEAIGVVFIDRSRPRDLLRVIPLVESALRDGTSVVCFPEGTTTDARSVSRFRSGLIQAAVNARASVTPLALSAAADDGETDALCWTGDETLVANIHRLASLRGARVTVHVAGPISDLGDRKALASRAHFEVEKRFRPLPRVRTTQERAAVSEGLSSVLAKQNFLPMESSDLEILA